MKTRLWLRWSWRDLRRRWLVVAAISTVIAIGTGLATGLGSMETWRIQSNDASFASLHVHDFRVSLAEGSFARSGQLEATVKSISDADAIDAVEERLAISTQIEASSGSKSVLVPTTLYGLDLAGGGPQVDGLATSAGRALRQSDSGKPVAALQETFAKANDLPAAGAVLLPGERRLGVVGFATSPEQFLLTTPEGQYSGAGGYGVVYTSLATAQALSGRRGTVNEIVIRLRPGSDSGAIGRQIVRAFRADPETAAFGADVTGKKDEDSYRFLYQDAHNDQQLFDAFSLLVLAAAGFASFTLIGRVIEAQRREMGIGMALGIDGRLLAVRPLLMGAQIALLGAALGVAAGFVIGGLMADVYRDNFALPEMRTGLELGIFARGAALGLLIPLLATVIPVWRGSRLSPVEAIHTGPRATKGAGLSRLLRGFTLPGSAIAQMPIRNLLRTPRRTIATLLAVASMITIVITFAGMLDSFRATIDLERVDLLATSPRRLDTSLDRFYPAKSAPVQALERSPLVAHSTTGVTTGGKLIAGASSIEIAVKLVRFGNPVWQPHVVEGHLPRLASEIVIARKAADDLGVRVGDSLTIEHPRRVGASAFRNIKRRIVISGLHANPLRGLAYLDYGKAAPSLGLGGSINSVTVDPKPGASEEQLKKAFFGSKAVASLQRASADVDELEQSVDQFVGIIRVAEIGALILTLLIAFNAISINVEERRRDYATLFAYGLPVRVVVRVGMIENAIVGALGTLVGIGLGALALNWIVHSLLPETFPELGMVADISTGSLGAAALVGIVAMVVAPLLVLRRLRKMDVPSTLRVVE